MAARTLVIVPALLLSAGCCTTDSATGLVTCRSCLGHAFGFLRDETPGCKPCGTPYTTAPAPMAAPRPAYPQPTTQPAPSWTPAPMLSPTPADPASQPPANPGAGTPSSSFAVPRPQVSPQPLLVPSATSDPPTLVVPGAAPRPSEAPVQFGPVVPSSRVPAPPAVRNHVSWGSAPARR